jgi:hypothetical protein
VKNFFMIGMMVLSVWGFSQELGDTLVLGVQAQPGALEGRGDQAFRLWSFSVTLKHPDTGWEHYADAWDIFLPDGTLLKANPEDKHTRVLWHPHVNEQPFTRGQRGIKIPAEATEVLVRGHDNVHGYGPEYSFVLPKD